MNTFTLGACFQHELHTGPYFMTFAPRLNGASKEFTSLTSCFPFFVAVFSKRNRKHVLRVAI